MFSSLMEFSYCTQKPTALFALPVEQNDTNHARHRLLTGIGSHVHYYKYAGDKWTKVGSVELLHCRCIHGFSAGPSGYIATFGQKAVRVFRISSQSSSGLEILTPLFEFEDWVLDLKWFTEQNKYALITSHNKVLVIDSNVGHVISCHTSELNCILYSASLTSLTTGGSIRQVSDILVLSGTVFNKIAVWRCLDQPEIKSPIEQELAGHNGVIFGIYIDTVRGCILSVSDDRTIRLWIFTPQTSGPCLTDSTSIHLQQVFRGHSARVWKAQLFDNLLISIGEDASIMVWNLDGQIKKTVSAHKGKNIWSMAADDHFLFTGGGDSSVKAWHLNLLLNGSNHDNQESEVVHEKVLSHPDQPINDFPRCLCLRNDLCIEITNNGSLNCQSLSQTDEICRHLLTDDRLKGYTVLCGHELDSSRLLICTGSSHGWICVLMITNTADIVDIQWLQFPHGKAMSCHILSRIDASNPLLLLSWENGHMDLYEVKLEACEISLISFLGHQLLLPKSKQRFVTCAALLAPDYLICADKMGSLYTYCLSSDIPSESLALPGYTLTRAHGKLGVTDMVVRNSLLYTAGRDGVYRVFSLQKGQLSLLNEHKVYKGLDWIGRLVFGVEENLLIAGFHTTEFVLFDVSLDQLVVRIDCGGGHRSWDLSVKSCGGRNHLYLAYIKSKQSRIVCQLIPQPFAVILPELHSAKISSCCCLTLHNTVYLVTCSDDTSVRLSKLTPQSDVICQPVSAMTRHISNVRCCCLIRSVANPHFHILVTGGGRAQLVATILSHGTRDEEAQLRYLSSIQLADRYLLTRKQLKAGENLNPDTRIMAVTFIHSAYTTHLVAVACSDGKIRFVILDEVTGHFSLLNLSLTYEHCPLVLHSETINTNNFFFVGTTGGMIHTYDVTHICQELLTHGDLSTSEPKRVLVLEHHQSGVNSFMVKVDTSAPNLTVYTGGDDNSIVISVIGLDSWSVLETQKFSTFHSAQITGIVGIDSMKFVSVSIDQRILLWKRGGNSWSVESVKHTTVADVAAVSYSEESGLLVTAGEGLEISQIKAVKDEHQTSLSAQYKEL